VVNSYPGNKQYRKFIDQKKQLYLTARFKREKRLISCQIVDQVRNLNPPGRFLMKDLANPSIWHDIGDEKARDKTSQTLRQTVLTVRRRLEEVVKLEEDFRKAQQANAVLSGVATKGPLPPPPKLSGAPMVWRSQPACQPIQQQTQQQQPPLEEFPSIDDYVVLDTMWSSKHPYNQEDDVADPSMEWGLM
jgi:hypothetical protein